METGLRIFIKVSGGLRGPVNKFISEKLRSRQQAGAISQDTMLELFRKGEILPDGRSNSEEVALLNSKAKVAPNADGEVVRS